MDTSLTKEELLRYNRHLILSDFGLEAQEKLKGAKVLVVGAGGLGSPLLLYLAAAGVGTIGIVDFDKVDVSNLQRQIIYGVSDIGKKKTETAKQKILELNPHVTVIIFDEKLTSENALEIIIDFDIVADGTDNFPTRYLINDACVILGIPNVYTSIYQYEGQLSVFNYTNSKGEVGPNYRDLFPDPTPPNLIPNCAEGGVLGVLAGIMGSMQANEVIKIITCVGDPLSGKLFLFNSKEFTTRTLKITTNITKPVIDKLIDYDAFCGINKEINSTMKEITAKELDKWNKNGKDYQLIDVREDYERDISHIGGELIPINTIESNIEKVNKDRDVVVYCRSGKRSADVIEYLHKNHGFDNLINLQGGILSYADNIDPTLTKY